MAEEAAIIAEELGETMEKQEAQNKTEFESDKLNNSSLAQHSQETVLEEDNFNSSNTTFYQPVWILDKVLDVTFLAYNCIARRLETTGCPLPKLDRPQLHCDAGLSLHVFDSNFLFHLNKFGSDFFFI